MPNESTEPHEVPRRSVKWLLVGLAVVALGAVLSVTFYRPPLPSAPEQVADDPLLAQGHELYQMRCVSCHGPTGRGDGPIAPTEDPKKRGILNDDEWHHGSRPEDVVGVIARGVPGTSMSGWSGTFNDDEIRALAAYVYFLARRDVPEVLRRPST